MDSKIPKRHFQQTLAVARKNGPYVVLVKIFTDIIRIKRYINILSCQNLVKMKFLDLLYLFFAAYKEGIS